MTCNWKSEYMYMHKVTDFFYLISKLVNLLGERGKTTYMYTPVGNLARNATCTTSC